MKAKNIPAEPVLTPGTGGEGLYLVCKLQSISTQELTLLRKILETNLHTGIPSNRII